MVEEEKKDKKRNIKGSWNVAEEYLKSLLRILERFYDATEKEDYKLAYNITRTVTNYTHYYYKRKEQTKQIQDLKQKAAKMYGEDALEAKNTGDIDKQLNLQKESIQAMFDIFEKVNDIFSEIGSYLPVTKEKNSIVSSMEMN